MRLTPRRVLATALVLVGATTAFAPSPPVRASQTELHLFRRLFRREKQPTDKPNLDLGLPVEASETPDITISSAVRDRRLGKVEHADLVIVGGGVSGLAAALTAAKQDKKVIILEAAMDVGGRVMSDTTDDGFTLDRGFAVFIEEYPAARQLLDYEALGLEKFLPGALVKLPGRTSLAQVADPLRQPALILASLLAPVGSLADKLALLPLIWHVKTNTVEKLFAEPETDTLTCLRDRWGLSDDMLDKFFKPFLEGIYLAPLEEQSSRMFHFIFKMFSEGAATLPQGGMGAVARWLADRAIEKGVELRAGQVVVEIGTTKDDDKFVVYNADGKPQLTASKVILATDGQVCQQLLAKLDGFESLTDLPQQTQRSVGNLYYTMDGDAPVKDPILILSGMGRDRGTPDYPINNICFPSVVNPSYAPAGKSLCSITVLEGTMDEYQGREKELDLKVRQQLGTWFRERKLEILNDWELKAIYRISKAQPSQLSGPCPANVNGGREVSVYRGKSLPKGMFVCGDHMATATLNGAIESGVNAGSAAAKA